MALVRLLNAPHGQGGAALFRKNAIRLHSRAAELPRDLCCGDPVPGKRSDPVAIQTPLSPNGGMRLTTSSSPGRRNSRI